LYTFNDTTPQQESSLISKADELGGGLTNGNRSIDKLTRAFDINPNFEGIASNDIALGDAVDINDIADAIIPGAGRVLTLGKMLGSLLTEPTIGPTNYTGSDTEFSEMVRTEQNFLKDLKGELAKKGIGSSFTYENDGSGGFIMNMEIYEPTDTPGAARQIINDLIESNPNYRNIQVDSF
jgi:hypothetical protein